MATSFIASLICSPIVVLISDRDFSRKLCNSRARSRALIACSSVACSWSFNFSLSCSSCCNFAVNSAWIFSSSVKNSKSFSKFLRSFNELGNSWKRSIDSLTSLMANVPSSNCCDSNTFGYSSLSAVSAPCQTFFVSKISPPRAELEILDAIFSHGPEYLPPTNAAVPLWMLMDVGNPFINFSSSENNSFGHSASCNCSCAYKQNPTADSASLNANTNFSVNVSASNPRNFFNVDLKICCMINNASAMSCASFSQNVCAFSTMVITKNTLLPAGAGISDSEICCVENFNFICISSMAFLFFMFISFCCFNSPIILCELFTRC